MSDGRKYEIGDKLKFTNDDGVELDGIIHGVSYQMNANHTKHSFEYIIVPADQHKAWWKVKEGKKPDLQQFVRKFDD